MGQLSRSILSIHYHTHTLNGEDLTELSRLIFPLNKKYTQIYTHTAHHRNKA